MRRLCSTLALASFLFAGTSATTHAGASLSLTIGDTQGYYRGVSNYYDVREDRVSLIVRRGLPYNEVPVALYIAGQAHVDPLVVVDMRLSGMPWIEVSRYFGLGADIYYVQSDQQYGPYMGYYQPFLSHPRSDWVSLTLSDEAMVNLANLRFTSQLYGVPAVQVMRWRAGGHNFRWINRELYRQRGEIPQRPMARQWDQPQQLPARLKASSVERFKALPARQRSLAPVTTQEHSQSQAGERHRMSDKAPKSSVPRRNVTVRSHEQTRQVAASEQTTRHQRVAKPGTAESNHGKKHPAKHVHVSKDKNGHKN
jgi:hypothetical protein